MQKRKLSFSDFEEIGQLREKRVGLQLKKARLEQELAERMRDHEAAERADPIQAGARTLAAGGELKEVKVWREELQGLRTKIQIFQRAERLVDDEMKRVESKASQEICRTREPEFRSAWKRFATKLVGVSEEAAAIREMYAELEGGGVMTSTLPVSLQLSGWDARSPDCRANTWIDSIEQDWEIEVPRELYREAEKSRYDRHMEEERIKAEHKAREEQRREQARKNAGKEREAFFRKLGLAG